MFHVHHATGFTFISDIVSSTSKGDPEKKSESRTPFSSKQSLSDIYEGSEGSASPRKHVMQSDNTTESSTDLSWPESPSKKQVSDKSLEYLDEMRPHKPDLKLSHEFRLNFSQNMTPEDLGGKGGTSSARDEQPTDQTSSGNSEKASGVNSTKSKSTAFNWVPGTGTKAEVGTDLPSGRESDASSVPTFTNMPVSCFNLFNNTNDISVF